MLKSKFYNTESRSYEPATRYVGRSIFARNQTVKVMSDIWEEHLVLHSVEEDGRIVENSVAGYTGDKPEWEVDGTEEAFEDYRAHREEFHFNTLSQDATDEAVKPSVKDRIVKVVKGRKAKGTVGKVVVVMDAYYGMGYRGYETKKLGIATSPRMIKVVKNGREYNNYADMEWVWAMNCEVETPEAIDTDAIRIEAQKRAQANLDQLRENAATYNVKKAS